MSALRFCGKARPHTVALPYPAAKAALNAFSRGLADKLAASVVRINVITPSATRIHLLEGEDGYAAQVAKAMQVDHVTLLANFPAQGCMLTGKLIEPCASHCVALIPDDAERHWIQLVRIRRRLQVASLLRRVARAPQKPASRSLFDTPMQ